MPTRREVIWVFLMAFLAILFFSGVVYAHDCSSPGDCEQTAGFLMTLGGAGGVLGLGSALFARNLDLLHPPPAIEPPPPPIPQPQPDLIDRGHRTVLPPGPKPTEPEVITGRQEGSETTAAQEFQQNSSTSNKEQEPDSGKDSSEGSGSQQQQSQDEEKPHNDTSETESGDSSGENNKGQDEGDKDGEQQRREKAERELKEAQDLLRQKIEHLKQVGDSLSEYGGFFQDAQKLTDEAGRLLSKIPDLAKLSEYAHQFQEIAEAAAKKTDALGKIGTLLKLPGEISQQLDESTATTGVGKATDSILGGALKAVNPLGYIDDAWKIATGHELGLGELLGTSSRATVTLAEGLIQGLTGGDASGLQAFQENSLAGKYGAIYKAAAEAGQFYTSNGYLTPTLNVGKYALGEIFGSIGKAPGFWAP